MGLFDSLFGTDPQTTTTALDPAQSAFIQRMIGREGELYPEVMRLLGYDRTVNPDYVAPSEDAGGKQSLSKALMWRTKEDAGGAGGSDSSIPQYLMTKSASPGEDTIPWYADQAYGAMTGEMDSLYPEIQDAITNFTMPEQALGFLDKLRDERITGIQEQTKNPIGDVVADMARRGMLSSSTTEGALGEVGKSIAPSISQAWQDYYNSRLTMPGQIAATRFNLAKDYGQTKSGAIRQKMQDKISPILSMYDATTGRASQPMGQTSTTTGGGPSVFQSLIPLGTAAIMSSRMSSREYKDGITLVSDIEDADNLEKVRRLELVRYHYRPEVAEAIRDDGKEHIGLIAEDAPAEIATADRKAVHLYDMVSMLTSAVRQLAREVDALKQEVRHAI